MGNVAFNALHPFEVPAPHSVSITDQLKALLNIRRQSRGEVVVRDVNSQPTVVQGIARALSAGVYAADAELPSNLLNSTVAFVITVRDALDVSNAPKLARQVVDAGGTCALVVGQVRDESPMTRVCFVTIGWVLGFAGAVYFVIVGAREEIGTRLQFPAVQYEVMKHILVNMFPEEDVLAPPSTSTAFGGAPLCHKSKSTDDVSDAAKSAAAVGPVSAASGGAGSAAALPRLAPTPPDVQGAGAGAPAHLTASVSRQTLSWSPSATAVARAPDAHAYAHAPAPAPAPALASVLAPACAPAPGRRKRMTFADFVLPAGKEPRDFLFFDAGDVIAALDYKPRVRETRPTPTEELKNGDWVLIIYNDIPHLVKSSVLSNQLRTKTVRRRTLL